MATHALAFGGQRHDRLVAQVGSEESLERVHPLTMQALIDHAPVDPEHRLEVATPVVAAELHLDEERVREAVQEALDLGS